MEGRYLQLLATIGVAALVTGVSHRHPYLQNGVQRGLDLALAVLVALAAGRALLLF